jgi:hypothetical protein
MMRRLAWALVAASSLLARDAVSQSMEASAVTFTVQSQVRFAGTRVEQSGQWMGGEGAIRVGYLRVGMLAAIGPLNGTDDALHPDSKGRATNITVHAVPWSWMALGAVAEAKAFETDVGTTVWRLLGVNVRLTPALDARSLEGLVDLSYWPMATVIGGETMPLALRAVVGATYRVAGGPLGIRFAYRFERFDFESQGSAPVRLEQFRGATLGALLRFGR